MGLAAAEQLHRPLAWVFAYVLDWATCNENVKRLRVLTTLFRWFDDPVERVEHAGNAERIFGREWAPLPKAHAANVMDLLAHPTVLQPTLHPGRFGLFLRDLHDGSLVSGGGVSNQQAKGYAPFRPGYAFVLDRWLRYFDVTPCPWPFWIFQLHPDVRRPT